MQLTTKNNMSWLLLQLFLVLGTKGVRAGDTFGPAGCVSVSKSTMGSCVITTNCKGHDKAIKDLEFAFTCEDPQNEKGEVQKGEVQKHSYGLGGFLTIESYDTEVKCGSCHAPPDAIVAASNAAAEELAKTNTGTAAATVETTKQKEEINAQEDAALTKEDEVIADRVSYGPGKCISTYKSTGGTCIVETDCTQEQVAEYEFGMVCAEPDGTLTKHVFGKNSFTNKEAFDTLIECKQCLGLDEVAEDGDIAKQVAGLKEEVSSLKTDLEGIKTDVQTIADTVKKKEEAKKAGEEAAAKMFLASKKSAKENAAKDDDEEEAKAGGGFEVEEEQQQQVDDDEADDVQQQEGSDAGDKDQEDEDQQQDGADEDDSSAEEASSSDEEQEQSSDEEEDN